ncbi:hypothetical protein E2C01_080292 [Portunus trituberculatus]|uniref:Uncharacterized protein n=1 Tax=Portunus trituberculatus TaxID=210409 RepID=A0A5B7IZ69_PORTR|nr:hypothetical protein [Portunus trituberculatus]
MKEVHPASSTGRKHPCSRLHGEESSKVKQSAGETLRKNKSPPDVSHPAALTLGNNSDLPRPAEP